MEMIAITTSNIALDCPTIADIGNVDVAVYICIWMLEIYRR